jgi:glycosyltransferase involved in cell wall biosynthesis
VREAYAQAHAFVLPSLYETFGVVFIEALAMGLPLIGTACGGPEEIITPENGLLIPKNDANKLQEAMARIMTDYPLYSSRTLRQDAIRRFGKETITNQLIESYRVILG